MAKTHLFTPTQLRSLSFDNRIVVSPMGQFSADENGIASPWHNMHLGSLALSGAGLLIVEATAVEARGRASYRCLGLWDDRQIEPLAAIADFCHAHGGAKIGVQLSHMGRKGSDCVPWEQGMDQYGGPWRTVAPSPVPYPDRPVPMALDKAGLIRIKDAFVAATQRADAAGFDLIEIHNAHGYLLHSFLSPHSNHREDGYGGSLENRMRFPLDVFRAARAVWPQDKPMGVRVSASDWTASGWTPADTLIFAEALKGLGCDYICASSGGSSPDQHIPLAPGYQVDFATQIRDAVGLPTMAVGLISDPQQAEDILAGGKADFIAIGRAMLHDPRWAVHAAEYFGEEVVLPHPYRRVRPGSWPARTPLPIA